MVEGLSQAGFPASIGDWKLSKQHKARVKTLDPVLWDVSMNVKVIGEQGEKRRFLEVGGGVVLQYR